MRVREKLDNIVAATEIADRLRAPRPSSGFRIWGDARDASFFVDTEAGRAMVTVVAMEVRQDLPEWFEIHVGFNEAVRKKAPRRRSLYDNDHPPAARSPVSSAIYGTFRMTDS